MKWIKKGLLTAGIIPVAMGLCLYTSVVSHTGEFYPSRIKEYFELHNQVFSGEHPLADSDSDGKVSRMEEAIAYEEMGLYLKEDKPCLELLRYYVKKKSFERN